MAKFSGKNIEFRTGQKAIFGDGDDSSIYWDDNTTSLVITTTASGVDPIDPGHLVTKRYLEDFVDTTISGVDDFLDLDDTPTTYSGAEGKYLKVVSSAVEFTNIDHGDLIGLEDDDHYLYVPTDGSRGFTSTVSGIFPVEDYHLVTKSYVLSLLGGYSLPPSVSGGAVINSLTQFQFEEVDIEHSTNSRNFQEILSMTVSGIPAGNYRLGWAFSWRQSKSNAEFKARIQIDNTDDTFFFQASPYVDILFWQPVASFQYIPLASGTHTIDLDYCTTSRRSTSFIKDSKIEFWRII